MTFLQNLIRRLFPTKIVSHYLSDLIHQSSHQNINTNHICLSIEKNNGSRDFCYLTMEELTTLYQYCPVIERSLYELICPTNSVKAYIDFEYYTENNLDIQDHRVGPKCCLKILHYLLNFPDNTTCQKENYLDIVLQQFLVLEA